MKSLAKYVSSLLTVYANPQNLVDAQIPPLGSVQRIFLVEDDELNRQLLSEYLGYLGYQVLSIASGLSFFENLEQFRPDLILLDLRLPKIDGYTLLERLQQHPDWRHTPVFVVSALALQAEQQKALDLGARQYFVKPMNIRQLVQAIQDLERQEPSSHQID